jgi:hypothetical protein
MLRSRELAAKSTFHCLQAICAQEVVDKISRTNHESLIEALYDYALDHNKGIVQLKGALLHSMFRQKYSLEDFNKVHLKKNPGTKAVFAANVSSDFRIFAELPVIVAYESTFKCNIKNILLTGDSMPTKFLKQKQSNPDAIVEIISTHGFKQTYQDVKSGADIIKHTTRGSLGIITYDHNQQVFPFTGGDLDLKRFNYSREYGIRSSLTEVLDKNASMAFEVTLDKVIEILKTEQSILVQNNNIQTILWNDIQCHPHYKRSVSFIFTPTISVSPSDLRFELYKNKFCASLSDRMYDLNKTQDRKDIFTAMLKAYYEVDPKFVQKLEYYHRSMNLDIDKLFLQCLAQVIKEGFT